MKAARLIIAAICCTLISGACTKQAQETKYGKQEESIERFVKQQTAKFPEARVVYQKGVVRIVLSEGEGVELSARGSATIIYAGYDFSDGNIGASTMFATNDWNLAQSTGWVLSDPDAWKPMHISLADRSIVPGLATGLEGMRKGEEAIILFSGKYGFGKHGLGMIPADAPLAYQVIIEDLDN